MRPASTDPAGLIALPTRLHRAFNARDFDVWRELFDEDVEFVVEGNTLRGVDAAVGYAEGIVSRFPGLHIQSDRVVAASRDTVVAEIDLANASGGPSRQQGTTCEIFRVRDGRVVSCRSYYMAEGEQGEGAVRVPDRWGAVQMAEEQASLRRVATLVARGVSQAELFAAVNEEVGWLVGADPTSLIRFDSDDTLTLVAAWSARLPDLPVGMTRPLDDALRSIRDTARAWRWGPAELPAAGPFVEEARRLGVRSAVAVPIVVDGSVWGAAFASSSADRPLAENAEARIAGFTELVATAIADAQARAELRALADEQAALRRVATLVTQDPPPTVLFAAVTEEVGRLLGADLAGMTRFVTDDSLTAVATWAAEGEHPEVPGVWPILEGDLSARIVSTGRPVREENWAAAVGPIAEFVHDRMGVRSTVGSPIVVEGRAWGGLFVHSTSERRLPADTEARLGNFTALVATAVANSQARADARRLSDEQAALRRVATLVARGSPLEEVFATVAAEVGRLPKLDDTRIVRYEEGRTATVVASSGKLATALPVGERLSMEEDSVSAHVLRTGRPTRIDDFAQATGSFAASLRALGVRSALGAPIVVDGRLWGAMSTATLEPDPIPPETEARIGDFTELLATAISNAKARSELAASRARVVAAADEERRRVVRDLHDGAQQRLVHTVVTLKLADRALESGEADAAALVKEALDHAQHATDELRELVHGIMPAVLTAGGLQAGVRALASRTPVPVHVDVAVDRLPAAVEATGYFVVAEALTNVSKHARAGRASVRARVEDGALRISVHDDGVGGARPEGTGLLGLRDRLATLDGWLRVESPASGGTLVTAEIPLPD